MAKNLKLIPRKYTFPLLYAATFFFSFHWFFVTYYNSSYISTYIDERFVGLVYVAGSALSAIALVFVPNLLKRVGAYNNLFQMRML